MGTPPPAPAPCPRPPSAHLRGDVPAVLQAHQDGGARVQELHHQHRHLQQLVDLQGPEPLSTSQAPRPHEVTPAESHTGSLHDRVWGEGALMSSCCSRFVGQASPTSGDSPSGCFHSTWWRSLLERRGLPDTLTGDGPGAATSAVSSKRRFSPSTLSFHFPSFAMCATPRAGEGGK